MGRAALGCGFLGVASCLDLISVLMLLIWAAVLPDLLGVSSGVIFCGRIDLIVLLESNSICRSGHEERRKRCLSLCLVLHLKHNLLLGGWMVVLEMACEGALFF